MAGKMAQFPPAPVWDVYQDKFVPSMSTGMIEDECVVRGDPVLDTDTKVESPDWKKDCLAWRNKAKNLEYALNDLEKENLYLKGRLSVFEEMGTPQIVGDGKAIWDKT